MITASGKTQIVHEDQGSSKMTFTVLFMIIRFIARNVKFYKGAVAAVPVTRAERPLSLREGDLRRGDRCCPAGPSA